MMGNMQRNHTLLLFGFQAGINLIRQITVLCLGEILGGKY